MPPRRQGRQGGKTKTSIMRARTDFCCCLSWRPWRLGGYSFLLAFGRLALKHPQHAIGDHEATDDVGRGTKHSGESEDRADSVVACPGSNNGADQRNARDGI